MIKHHSQEIDLIQISEDQYLAYLLEAETLSKAHVRTLEDQRKRQTRENAKQEESNED